MKVTMTVECDCGVNETFTLKRTINAHDDERGVYEDFSSIEDGLEDSTKFKTGTLPDEVILTCLDCSRKHSVMT